MPDDSFNVAPGTRVVLGNADGQRCVIEIIAENDDGSYLVEIVETDVTEGPWSELGKITDIIVEPQ